MAQPVNPRAPQDKLNSQRRELEKRYTGIRRKSAATTHCTLQTTSKIIPYCGEGNHIFRYHAISQVSEPCYQDISNGKLET